MNSSTTEARNTLDPRAADPSRSLGDLVTELPGAARIFERHGLDYCCGGGTSLEQACADAEVATDDVLTDLRDLDPAPAPDWASMAPPDLVDHIVGTHHRYLRAEIPRLNELATKVAGVHGDRHPELHRVREVFARLGADLLPHMVKEERVLFPAVQELHEATTMPWFPFGTPAGPISVMLAEHDDAGEMLEQLRSLTDGYRPPADGCASYHALYEGLAEFESDLHLHVHKENNVLFPAVSRRERELSSAGPPATAR